jgi:hypothetical protein
MSSDSSLQGAEIMRLQRKLEARDEVIRQLNRQLHDAPLREMTPDSGESPSVLEEYAYRARLLDEEVASLREQLTSEQLQQEALRNQLAAASSASVGAAGHRGTVRRVASRVRRRFLR